MYDHIERMKTEHKELKEKVEAVNAFIHGNAIFNTLDDMGKARLIKQSGFMESYLSVLESRIWTSQG